MGVGLRQLFLRGKGGWVLSTTGCFTGKSVYKITVVHGAGKGKIVCSGPEIMVMTALNR